MKEKSFWRGHPITWVVEKNKGWVFTDTKEPVIGFGGKLRPCMKCGKTFDGSNVGEPDPCLGNLPGVDNACCGHGEPSESYIRFTSGVVIKGFTEVEGLK